MDERNRQADERNARTESFRERICCCRDGDTDRNTDTDADTDADLDGNADPAAGTTIRRNASGNNDADSGGFPPGGTGDAASGRTDDGNAFCAHATRDEIAAEETVRLRVVRRRGVDCRTVRDGKEFRKAEPFEYGIGCGVAVV